MMIRVTCTGSASAQTAVIGHELQHAIEVAGAAAVVDLPSFDREFARIGFVTSHGDNRGSRSYETRAARDAGERILRELRDRT